MFIKEGDTEGIVKVDVSTLIKSVTPMPEGRDSFVAGQITQVTEEVLTDLKLPYTDFRTKNRFDLARLLQQLGVRFYQRAETWKKWPGYGEEGAGKTYREELALYKAGANTLEASIDLYDPNADQLPLVATSYLICVSRALDIAQRRAQKFEPEKPFSPDDWQISKGSKVREVREFISSLVGKGIKVAGVDQKIVEYSLRMALDTTDWPYLKI